ncbi:MAG: hypothetical protein PW786_07565 [Arachidicoccus sp.]|nr:hypothetical protein [Arachidicoccus sp.]
MKIFFISAIIFTGLFTTAFAQNDIPTARQSFHDRIDKAQLALEAADRTADGQFTPYYDNNELNKASNKAATEDVDDLQKFIEKQDWDNNTKLKYLRGVIELLEGYRSSFIVRGITGAQLVNALKAYKEAMIMDKHGDDISSIIGKYKYEVAVLIARNYAFQSNPGKNNFNNILVRKNLDEHPSQALGILNGLLKTDPDFPAADSIIHAVAKDSSDAIYTYAQSYTPLGEKIRKSNDPLVSTISKIANAQGSSGSRIGRQYMPFLDALYKGDISMDKVEDAMNDDVIYFKLLVKTEIQYAANEQNKDTAMALQIMKDKISDWGINKFINVVNGLHEKSNDVRYACLKPLSPIDLYYLIVTSEEVIYTSTYVNGKDYGIYNLIWQKGGKELTGDSLLMSVQFDYYKKWIKMAANYNTLDNFLSKMDPESSRLLMKAFVRGLDKSSTKNPLEDAVDVAGSYSSIDDPAIKQLVLNETQDNLDKAKRERNTKAYNIYYILNTLFLSMDSSNNIDVSERLGIEPVYFLPIDKLKDSTGKIYIQQFTYGDQDGNVNYERFMDAFSRLGWKTSVNKYWSTVSSTKGVPITIFTNRPLDEKQHLDDDAQDALNNYLDENDIHPTLAFHRGHSYYLKSSVKQLQPSERLVFLGSCGGFQSLNDVLKASPGTQIISTKQTGAGDLNLPMIRDIILTLQKGQDLNWVKMWKGFSKQLSSDTRFADYVPPYENLGAVFLVAYQKLQDKEKEKADTKDITIGTKKE